MCLPATICLLSALCYALITALRDIPDLLQDLDTKALVVGVVSCEVTVVLALSVGARAAKDELFPVAHDGGSVGASQSLSIRRSVTSGGHIHVIGLGRLGSVVVVLLRSGGALEEFQDGVCCFVWFSWFLIFKRFFSDVMRNNCIGLDLSFLLSQRVSSHLYPVMPSRE